MYIYPSLPQVTWLSFVDGLGFLTAAHSIGEVRRTLEKSWKNCLRQGANNSVTYDMSKTEAILFSKARHQKLVG